MPPLTVEQLIADGARYADTEVEVIGWAADQFEHRAIYDFLNQVTDRTTSKGIWLAGTLPAQKVSRGEGPLHTLRVKIIGKFHWQPKRGAGHLGAFPAWIGANACSVLNEDG